MGSEAAQVEAAVEVDDVAGGERELPGEHGADRAADVLGRAPAPLRDEALGDQPVVLVLPRRSCRP
jgi:hypothetical protein